MWPLFSGLGTTALSAISATHLKRIVVEKAKCFLCKHSKCENKRRPKHGFRGISCWQCKKTFRTMECYDVHSTERACVLRAMCKICRRIVDPKKLNPPSSHNCLRQFCGICQTHYTGKRSDHICYMQIFDRNTQKKQWRCAFSTSSLE